MSIERELKLTGDLPDLEQLPDLGGCRLTYSRTEQQTNTYFDTPDLALRRAGMSLRLRQIAGSDGVYTWKGESAVQDGWHSKPELEVSARGATDLAYLIDPEIVTRVTAVVPLEALRPTLRLRTTRRVYLVDGVGELALDEANVLALDEDVVLETFNELELEVNGDAASDDVERVSAALRALPGLAPSTRSKSARAAAALERYNAGHDRHHV
jgi:inorganic triphosphatase YgiF